MASAKERSFLKEGSIIFKENFWKLSLFNLILVFIFLALFFLAALIIGLSFIGSGDNLNIPTASIVFFTLYLIIIFLFFPILGTGYQYIFVRLVRKEEIAFKNIFVGFKNFWSIWFTYYFTGAICFAGIFLFLIPVFLLLFFTIGIHYLNIPAPIVNSYYLNSSLATNTVILTILIFTVTIIASIYWGTKLLFTHLAAIDRKLYPGDAIYYGNNITKGNKLKILLNVYIPSFVIFVLFFILSATIRYNDTGYTIYNIITNIINVFILVPWFSSIIATAYVRLSDNFDNNLPGNFLNRFTVKKIVKDKPVTNIDDKLDNEKESIEDNKDNEKKYKDKS